MIGADIIQAAIIRHLEEADLVLCDISLHNPNVFFELGIRTALDLPVAVVKDDKTDKLPFDTSIINTYSYDSTLSPWLLDRQVAEISEHIRAASSPANGRNALWQYFGLTKRAALPGRTDDPNAAKMDLMLEEIKRIRLENITSPPSQPSVSDLETAKSARTVQFLATAVASKNNPNGRGLEEYPKNYRSLIADLARIADGAHAAIKVIRVANDSITIDAGPFYINSATQKLLERRVTQDATELILLGDHIGASPE